MAFAHPEAWLWAFLAVPLILVHSWKGRPRIVNVPAVFLWRQSLASDPARTRRLWGQRFLSLGVDLVALLLIVAAVAEPVGWNLGWTALSAAALGLLGVQTIAVLRLLAPLRPTVWLVARGAMLLALAVALTGPTIHGPTRPVYPVFLIDHSASIAPEALEAAHEFVARAVEGRNGWAEVRFAETPWLAGSDGPSPPKRARCATDLAAALAFGFGIAPSDTTPHLILLSDGVATQGDLEAALESARREGIPISTVPLAACDPEVYVAEVQTPPVVREKEPFEAAVAVWSSQDGEGSVEVVASSGMLTTELIRVRRGETWHKVR